MAASGSSTPAALGPAGVAAFISKVWSILTNEEYKTLISWSEVSVTCAYLAHLKDKTLVV